MDINNGIGPFKLIMKGIDLLFKLLNTALGSVLAGRRGGLHLPLGKGAKKALSSIVTPLRKVGRIKTFAA